MVDDIEETPRGVELSIGIAVLQNLLQDAINAKARMSSYSGQPESGEYVLATLDFCNQIYGFCFILKQALDKLATRGFFDDNDMELAMHVLRQLGKTINGGT